MQSLRTVDEIVNLLHGTGYLKQDLLRRFRVFRAACSHELSDLFPVKTTSTATAVAYVLGSALENLVLCKACSTALNVSVVSKDRISVIPSSAGEMV